MVSIEQIIQQEVNPFDPVTFKTGNFWQEDQDSALTIESIHQEAIDQITEFLAQVARDHCSRTLMLAGDSGSGKSYLLSRVKRVLNNKAFFAYIGPWAASDHIWRHTLRYTVDSLMHKPANQQESQLLLWLKSRSVFTDRSLMKKLLGERGLFINNFRATYPTSIYNANAFFSVLYYLTQPETYQLACEWLKGDDLDEDSLKALGVRSSINTEDAAQNILANFGRISAETQPIVLCFDQIEDSDRLPNRSPDLQPLFSVNTTFRNEKLKNFLVIISIVTNTWKQNLDHIQQSDRARVEKSVLLKPITLKQAEALWASRLYPLHRQATPQPPSPIYPLNEQSLEEKFPGGKTHPRPALELGRRLLLKYKTGGIIVPEDPIAAFKLLWHQEFQKTQQKVSGIRQFSSPELVQMLTEALKALQVRDIKPKLLFSSPKFASYSLSYQLPARQERVGVVWTEDPNTKSFFTVMDACEKAIKQNLCQTLYLIRAEGVGTPNLKGNQLYKQIFTGYSHSHLKLELTSIHYLDTYHSLVNAAGCRELVVAGKTQTLEDLEALIRESKILNDCPLLQELKIVPPIIIKHPLEPVKEFLFNLVITQQMMGRLKLIQNACSQFSQVDEPEIEKLIQELCHENKIKIIPPNAKPQEQSVCWVPEASLVTNKR